ncbi:MAG TPA: TlpA disulfide reductase family protein [Terracidiphilus sp.]|nr:TlpA disulfide reductase family protein [Terracidiphilus sp.]
MLGAIRGTDGVLKLPPGRYSLHILLEKVDRQAQPFEVADRDLTLPTLHFALAPIPQHYGHGTPTISTLWDMKNRPFEIGSTKGQWTLLYFWHYTCAPCIQKGIPELADFVSSHRAERNRFRVLAIHVNEGEDWDTFHTHTLMLEKQPWHSVPPFPFIYDKTGRLTADWGIVSFPTVALIDPAGNLVSDGSLQKLDEALATSHAQPDSAQARSR